MLHAQQSRAETHHVSTSWLHNAGIPLSGAASNLRRWHSPIKRVLVGVWHVHNVHEASVPCKRQGWELQGETLVGLAANHGVTLLYQGGIKSNQKGSEKLAGMWPITQRLMLRKASHHPTSLGRITCDIHPTISPMSPCDPPPCSPCTPLSHTAGTPQTLLTSGASHDGFQFPFVPAKETATQGGK